MIAVERSGLARTVASWVMQNPANHCYVNSSMIAMVWANLHRLHFSFDDWGVLQEGLKAMMQCGTDPFLILEMKQFQTLPNLQLFSCPRWTQPLFTASGKEGLLERLVR